MREILFRGKRIANGEWVYGSLIDGIYGAVPVIVTLPSVDDDFKLDFEYDHIDPSTVGQYTGLTDKNGKRIFEGDIVRENYGEHYCSEHLVVAMDDDRCGWFPFACGDGCGCCETYVWDASYSEVIGNIHDNPELLKEG